MKKGELLSKAIFTATHAHFGQFDRGGKPYILHPLRVMSFIKDDDEELLCIAVLHDVVEDTDVTWKNLIEVGMTDRIISALKLLTKVPGQTQEEYEEGIFSSIDAMKVKQCDLRHNSDLRRLKGITDKDLARNSKYQMLYFKIQQKLQETK